MRNSVNIMGGRDEMDFVQLTLTTDKGIIYYFTCFHIRLRDDGLLQYIQEIVC